MKQSVIAQVTTGAILVVVSVLLLSIGAQAQEQGSQNPQPTQEVTTTALDAEETEVPVAVQERLQKYKEKATEKLTAAKETRLKARCQNAQTKLSTIASSAATVVSNRQSAYQKLIDRVSELSDGLAAAGVDVASLDTAVAELQSLLDTFVAESETYQQSLSDLSAMDCTADPTAFQAALLEARRARTALFQGAQSIRTYMQDSVRARIAEAREQLASVPSIQEDATSNQAVTEESQE